MAHILLYGGTFDPVHHGHLITCRRAMELLNADSVLLFPARQSPHKTAKAPGATAEQRLEMLRLAIGDEAGFAVDARELSREGPSYTIDTFREVAHERPGDRFTLLLGTDQLPKLHTWHKVDQLLAEVPVAIMGRSSTQPFDKLLAPVEEHLGSSMAQRFRRAVLMTPLIDISATEIRQRVGMGLPITFLVPHAVAAYISDNTLYRE